MFVFYWSAYQHSLRVNLQVQVWKSNNLNPRDGDEIPPMEIKPTVQPSTPQELRNTIIMQL